MNYTKLIFLLQIHSNNILIAKQYTGVENNYAYNLAIIKLDSEQKLNANAKTACVYWDNDFVESELEVKFMLNEFVWV